MALQTCHRKGAVSTSQASPAASTGRSIHNMRAAPFLWHSPAPNTSVVCHSSISVSHTQQYTSRQQPQSCSRAPAASTTSSRPSHVCQALEKYLYEKLSAAEMTHKELQLRMADPEVAGDAQEFLRVAKAAGEGGSRPKQQPCPQSPHHWHPLNNTHS